MQYAVLSHNFYFNYALKMAIILKKIRS